MSRQPGRSRPAPSARSAPRDDLEDRLEHARRHERGVGGERGVVRVARARFIGPGSAAFAAVARSPGSSDVREGRRDRAADEPGGDRRLPAEDIAADDAVRVVDAELLERRDRPAGTGGGIGIVVLELVEPGARRGLRRGRALRRRSSGWLVASAASPSAVLAASRSLGAAFAGFGFAFAAASRSASGDALRPSSRCPSAAAFASSSVSYGPSVRARPSSSSASASVRNQRPAPPPSIVNRSSAER